MTFKCEYCNKTFKKENTIAVHMCEKKRRFKQEHDKNVQLAFRSYQLFYKIGTNSKKEKTYSDFANSNYYNGFVKFAGYCMDLNVDDVAGYTRWLLNNQVKLDSWASDRSFTEWQKSRIKNESVDRAVERTVLFFQSWSEQTGNQFNDYFRLVNPNVAVFDICSGKISPWVLFNCETAEILLEKMNEEQIRMVIEYIDPTFWTPVFRSKKEDVEWVKQLLANGGLN